LQTAYIERVAEFGLQRPKDVSGSPLNTLHARDLLQLADALGA
jgi:2-haloacid dehalogenase